MKLHHAFVLFLLFSFAAFGTSLRCPICGMEFKDSARTSFETTKDSSPTHLCSFSCSRRFHAKFPTAKLYAHDFASGKKIPAADAFYLAKSKNVVKELNFDMPPTVVAFEFEIAAKAKRQQLEDGVVVKGFEELEKVYE